MYLKKQTKQNYDSQKNTLKLSSITEIYQLKEDHKVCECHILRVQSALRLCSDPPDEKNAQTPISSVMTYTGGRLPSYSGFSSDWQMEEKKMSAIFLD